MEALRRNDYNVARAAEETGMQRMHFQALLKKQGLRLRDLPERQPRRLKKRREKLDFVFTGSSNEGGEVPERSNGPVLKTGVPARVP